MNFEVKISDSLIEYSFAVSEMEQRVEKIINKSQPELIWFLEHYDVYTIGTDGPEYITKMFSIPVVRSGRGGKYTYHGPGQMVCYVMMDLKVRNLCDIRRFVWALEEIAICALAKLGISGIRKDGSPGVWVNVNGMEKKIVALGIRIRRWVTFHGFAVNVSPKMENYSYISPCGFTSDTITSIAELGIEVKMNDLQQLIIKEFKSIY